ncbi:MAG: hypothetical protein AB7F70_11730 [Candidatus Omnitrophota bacterium]
MKMNKKVFSTFLGLLVGMMVLTQAVFAEDVYITKNGKKYHKKDSRFIKGKEVEKLTVEEAEARGYEPSSDFLKDEIKSEKPAESK